MNALKPNQTLHFPIPNFLTKKNLVQPWSGEHTILDKSISTLKIKCGCLDHPPSHPKKNRFLAPGIGITIFFTVYCYSGSGIRIVNSGTLGQR